MTSPDDPRPPPPPAWAPPAATPSGAPPPDPATRSSWAPPAVPPAPGRPREPVAGAALAVGLASLALVLLLLPPFLLGFAATVVGSAALLRLRGRPERSGRAMAAIGITAGVVSIQLAIVLISALPIHDRSPSGAVTVPYSRLNLGDCYQRTPRPSGSIEVVSCGLEHDRQAIGAVEHPTPAGVDYPGGADLAAFADEHCQAALARFVDLPAEQAGLVAANQAPTAAAWADGSRHIVCAVASRDGTRLVGSVADNSVSLPAGPPR